MLYACMHIWYTLYCMKLYAVWYFLYAILHKYAGFTECATYMGCRDVIHTTKEYAIHTIDSMHYTRIESVKYIPCNVVCNAH